MRWSLLFVAGCYSPTVQPGTPCSNDGSCPTGLVCSPASSTCELTAVDAFVPRDLPIDVAMVDAAMVDAPHDAPPVDAPPAPPQAVLVQQITNQNTSGPGISATFTTKPTAGDLLVMVGANPSRLIDTVTGAATWKLLARSNVNINTEIWVGVATGMDVTVSFSTTDGDAPNEIWLGEFTHASANVDVAGTATSGKTSPATVPVLTTAADDLAIFSVGDGMGNTFGNVVSWTAGTQVTTGSITQGVWFRNLGPNAVEAPTVTETAHLWDSALAVVKRQ